MEEICDIIFGEYSEHIKVEVIKLKTENTEKNVKTFA
jgi:hypothetical protein